MKFAIINGSPKEKKSVSGIISAALCERLIGDGECAVYSINRDETGEIVKGIQNAAALVFVFPLYVDALPSSLVEFLDGSMAEIAGTAPGAKVYAIVNNGFYEAGQNAIAISIMKNFSGHAGLSWGRGMGIGAGPILLSTPIGRGPAKNYASALDVFARGIIGLETDEDYFAEPNMPRFLYKQAGNLNWKNAAKKRGMKVKQLYGKP